MAAILKPPTAFAALGYGDRAMLDPRGERPIEELEPAAKRTADASGLRYREWGTPDSGEVVEHDRHFIEPQTVVRHLESGGTAILSDPGIVISSRVYWAAQQAVPTMPRS